MGETAEETIELIVKDGDARPHTSLGIPNACQSRSSSRLSEQRSPGLLWKSSTKYIDPGYGYQRDWRSSRTRVEGGGDSHLGSAVSPVDSDDQKQWRSSIRYINPGSGACSAAEWKSSIKAVKQKDDGSFIQWKPTVRVFKLSECCSEWTMKGGRRHVPASSHSEPGWRSSRGPGNPPSLTWVPPFRALKSGPHKSKGWRMKVPCYARKHQQLQLFSPMLEMKERSNPGNMLMPNAKEIRSKVAAYFEMHPPLHLFSSKQNRLGADNSSEGESYHSMRRYIPGGHEDHIENAGCTPRPGAKPPLDSIRMWCGTGPQHDPANTRNVILGKLGPLDDWKPPKVTLGPSLLAPAAGYNKDVIDSRFAEAEGVLEPEIPSYSSTLFGRANERAPKNAYERNATSLTGSQSSSAV